MLKAGTVALLVVLLGDLAVPDVRAEPTPAAPPAAYHDWLKQGRAAEEKHDFKAAAADFAECLKLVPGDPAALSDLGWTLYQAGDLAGAEDATRKALAGKQQKPGRAAAFYNLGRVLEDRGDKPGAIAAYRESVTTRQNPVVRARLATLDPAAAAELDPFVPQPMAGPFKREKEFCKNDPRIDRETEEGMEQEVCECAAVETAAKVVKLTPPYTAARLYAMRCGTGRVNHDSGEDHVELALKTKAGWYVTKDHLVHEFERHDIQELGSWSITVKPTPGGPLLLWTAAVTRMEDDGGGESERDWDTSYLTVIGSGASGKPGATPSIMLADKLTRTRTGEDGKAAEEPGGHDVTLRYELVAGGIKLAGSTKGLDPDVAAALVGQHPLVFP